MTSASASTTDLHAQLVAFGPVIRRAIHNQVTTKKDNCIGASRVALDILRAARISDAYALSVRLSIFNKAFVDRVDAEGRMPTGQAEVVTWGAECGAWSVGVGLTDVPLGPDRWPGHLVVIVGRKWLWDMTIDQGDRPQYGIVFPEPLVIAVTEPFLRGRERLLHIQDDGTLVTYDARPTDKSFKLAPDWINSRAEVNVS